MEVETPLAESIRTIDKNAQLDAACKQVLAVKIILAWIMKCCLEEFRDHDVNEIAEKYIEGEPAISKVAVSPDKTNADQRIHGISNEDTSLTEGTVTYDIRFLARVPRSGELIRIIIDLEAQGNYYPGYPLPKRGIYYCCRMISAQYGTEFTNSNYQDIKKVYSIFIAIKPPLERQNTITRYRIVEENMVGSVKEPVETYDLMTLLMICLGRPEDTDCDILRLLDVLLSNDIEAAEKQQVLKDDFGIPMTRELERGLHDMCDLGVAIEREGIAKGRAEGRSEGRVEGRAEGITEGILSAIRSLTETMGVSVEKAMAALKIPESEQRRYLDLLAKQ